MRSAGSDDLGPSARLTGGTLDKIESIVGMRTDLAPDALVRQVNEVGGCFGAQTETLVPADRALYALRDASATVESVPLIVSSILSKKFAEGIGGVVIDVKCGAGAFMRTLAEARELASALEGAGDAIGIPVKTVITAMDEPLGLAVGNALEVEEAIHILEGRGPADAMKLTLRLVAEMLLFAGLVRTPARERRSRGRHELGTRDGEVREDRVGPGRKARFDRRRRAPAGENDATGARSIGGIRIARRCADHRGNGAGDGWGQVHDG